MNKEVVGYVIYCGEHLLWASTDIDEATQYYNEHNGKNDPDIRFVVSFETITKSVWWD